LANTRPLPTASTSPWFGFSFAEPGSTIPPAVFVSSSLRRTTTRSCKGRIFMSSFLQQAVKHGILPGLPRSEEHTSDSSHVKISYAVFCLKKKRKEHIDEVRSERQP